jgi:hypothetical protein
MDDGPGYFGYGLPFPFRAFSGVSSLEYNFLPFVYLLDLVLMTALFLPKTILVARKVRACQGRCIPLATVGTLLVGALFDQRVGDIEPLGYPVTGADSTGDKYFRTSVSCDARFGPSRMR